MPTTRARRLISLLSRSQRVGGPDLAPVRPRERGEGEDLGLGLVHQRADLGEPAGELVRTWSQVAATASASGWAKMVRNTAATMSVWVLGTMGEQVAGEVDPAPLVRRRPGSSAERLDQAGVLVGDHQPHPGQPAALQAVRNAAPEHLVLAVADVESEDLPAAVGGDPGGDHDRLGDHLARPRLRTCR